MHKILFVCHGNICRSPMAEFVMKHLVSERGAQAQFLIRSAATSTEELGSPVHRGTCQELTRRSIPMQARRATLLDRPDYEEYDLLIGMDGRNVQNMRRILGGDPQGKIHLLMDFAGAHQDIADPWYTGDFARTYRDVDTGCHALLAALLGDA